MEALNFNTERPASGASDDRPLGYLEVLQRGDKVVQRIPVRSARIHVGRAYDNDLILDDPFVCPHHLILQWTGEQLQVTDLQSLNGIARENHDPSASSGVLDCGEQLRIGRTTLRFRSASFPVAPARRADNRLAVLDLFERPFSQFAIILLMVALFLLNNFLDTTTEYKILKAIPGGVGLLVMVFLWAMLWSFAGRIMLHRWNFWCHCSVAGIGLFINQLCDTGIAYFAFAFGVDDALTPLTYGCYFLVIGAVLYLNLHFASLAPPRRLLTGAFGVAAAMVGLMVMFNVSRQQDFSSEPKYLATFKAPAFKLVASQSSEAFFAGTQGLMAEVDAKVAEAEEKSAN